MPDITPLFSDTPEDHFVQLQICISLMDRGWAVDSRGSPCPPLSTPCLPSSAPCPVSPLLEPLLPHQLVFLCIASLCRSHKNLVTHRITSRCRRLYKTVVVPQKGKGETDWAGTAAQLEETLPRPKQARQSCRQGRTGAGRDALTSLSAEAWQTHCKRCVTGLHRYKTRFFQEVSADAAVAEHWDVPWVSLVDLWTELCPEWENTGSK